MLCVVWLSVAPPVLPVLAADNATKPEAVSTSASDATSAGANQTQPGLGLLRDKPDKPLPSFGWGGYFKSIGAVFLVLFGAAFALHFLRKRLPTGGGFGRGDLRLEGRLALGPKQSVVVVRFLNQRLVLGVAEAQITLLAKTDDDDDRLAKAFADRLEESDRSKEP